MTRDEALKLTPAEWRAHVMQTVTENAAAARNRAYTEHFRDGMYAACNGKLREEANAIANKLPVAFGDAFLAGYYAEKRKLRQDEDSKIVTKEQRK